jgi:hypothetical protein
MDSPGLSSRRRESWAYSMDGQCPQQLAVLGILLMIANYSTKNEGFGFYASDSDM